MQKEQQVLPSSYLVLLDTDPYESNREGQQELHVVFDRDLAARYGVSGTQIADSVAQGGARVGVVRGRIMALEICLRALAGLSRWDEIAKCADGYLHEAERAGCRTRTWRMLGSRARAREALGDVSGANEDREAAGSILRELATSLPQGVST